ncbi:hypothetical protein LCER1_G005111, partial [Lachnellula cervina]
FAAKLVYEFKGNEKVEYTTLFAAAYTTIQFIINHNQTLASRRERMCEYLSDLTALSLTRSTYFPEKKDNPDNAWSYRFISAHKSPSSTLLKGKTVCVKDKA